MKKFRRAKSIEELYDFARECERRMLEEAEMARQARKQARLAEEEKQRLARLAYIEANRPKSKRELGVVTPKFEDSLDRELKLQLGHERMNQFIDMIGNMLNHSIKNNHQDTNLGDKNKGGVNMNLQLLASNETAETEELDYSLYTEEELNKNTVKKLITICKELSISGYSRKHKDEIIDMIVKEVASRRKHLPMKYESSTSQAKMEEITDDIMKNMYENVILCKRFDISSKNGEIKIETLYQNIYGTRIVELGQLDFTTKNVIMTERNDEDEIKCKQIIRVSEETGNAVVKGLVLINIKNSPGNDIKEKGFYLTKDSKGEVTITKDEEEAISGRYVFAATSTSMKKKCAFFAVETSEGRTKDDIRDEINELTGGAWYYALKALDKRRKAGELITPADYGKVNERVGLVVCTPMIKFTEINSILIFNDEISYGPQFDKETEAKMKDMHMDIPLNFGDGGNGGVSYKIIQRGGERYGVKLTKEQAMRLPVQSRTLAIIEKGLRSAYDEDMMLCSATSLINLITEDYDPITLVDFTTGIVKTGRELKALLNSKNKENRKYAKELLRGLELITTKDEAKMINWDALNMSPSSKPAVSPLEFFVIDISKDTSAKHSNQMLNKTTDVSREGTLEYVEAQAWNDFLAQQDNTNKELVLDKNGNIAGLPLDNLYAVNYDRAIKDKLAETNNLVSLDKYFVSKVGKANVKANTHYLKILPFDITLSGFNRLCGAKTIDYITEENEKVKVTLNIAYSTAIDKEIKAKEELIDLMDISDEEKALEKQSLRAVVSIKYPAQGRNEFGGLYLISKEELDEIIESNDKLTKFQKAQCLKKVKYCPSNISYLFGDSGLLVQCAGSDFDGDAMADKLKEVSVRINEEGKEEIVTGIVNPVTNKRVLGYNSLVMKKLNKFGSKATVIGRHDKRKEEEKEQYQKELNKEQKTVQLNIKNMRGVINVPKLNNNTNEEQNRQITKEDVINLIQGECTISNKVFMKLPYVYKEVEITDWLGLYQATSTMGDNVGITITSVSVLVMADTDAFFDENDNFNLDLAADLLVPLNKEIERINKLNKSLPEHKKVKREEIPYDKSLFDDEKRRLLKQLNTSGMERDYYLVLNETINEWARRMKHLPANTTREQWELLTNDFDQIGRNLGETSIDVCKDESKANDLTIENLINTKYRCVGNMKPGYLKSNLNKILYNEANEYHIDCGRFTPGVDPTVLPDAIGEIKLTLKEICEYIMGRRVAAVKDRTKFNYDHLNKYNTDLVCKYPNMTDITKSVLEFMVDTNNKAYDLPRVEKDLLREIEMALLNTAGYDGMPREDVIKLMIQLCCIFTRRQTNKKGDIEFVPTFDINTRYLNKLKYAAKVFPEIFLQEYQEDPTKPLMPKLNYDVCTKEVYYGETIDLVNGWNEDKTLHVRRGYTGKAIATENGLYGLYNAYDKKKSDLIIVPICQFTGEYAKSYMKEAKDVRLVQTEDKELLITDKSKQILALTYFNNMDKLDGKELTDVKLYGYTIEKEDKYTKVKESFENYFVIGKMK